MKNKKILLALFLAFLVLVLAGVSYFKSTSNENAFNTHLKKAEEFEKQGRFSTAIEELNKALKYVSQNEQKKRTLAEKKLKELKEKLKKEEAAKEGTESANNGNGSSGNSTATPVEPPLVKIRSLASLLPERFEGIESKPVESKDVASVRFDDVDSRTTYIVYVYRHKDADSADNFIKVSREKTFSKNVREISLEGAYKGLKGFYGENDQGDSALSFAYSNLVFEILMRTETIDTSNRLKFLLKLQQGLKKP